MKISTKPGPFLILAAILLVSVCLHFYNLGSIPVDLHADEASHGFNAYSLFITGKDMYGKTLPILFRANGSYQTPIYTYLSIIPVHFLGNTIFSIRLVSALSGVMLVFLTYLLLKLWGQKGLIAAGVVAISPWAIQFGRPAVEANLAVTIFALSVIVFSLSFRKPKYLLLASLLLGISTHAYYSERIVAVLFLPLFILLFRKIFFKYRFILIASLVIFAVTQIPHIYILQTGALTKRFTQVSYLGGSSLPKEIGEFASHFLMYYSPRNLFFDTGSKLGMNAPELGVFYDWFFIPLLFGFRYLFKRRKENLSKLFFLLLLLTPIPAALTGDLFYPLRALDFFWAISMVIALGIYEIWVLLKYNFVRVPIFLLLLGYSLVSLYISYFILFKYESDGSAYIKLIDVLNQYKGRNIWLDYSDRAWGEGIRLAYLEKADPPRIQLSLSSQQQTPYYSSEVNSGETYVVDNITVKPIKWVEICGKIIVVGDEISISSEQIVKHKLKLEFEVSDVTGKPKLFGYSTGTICPSQK